MRILLRSFTVGIAGNEDHARRASHDRHKVRETGVASCGVDRIRKPPTLPLHDANDVALPVRLSHRQVCRQSRGLGTERRGQQERAGGIGAQPAEFHQLAPTGQSRDGEAVADSFPPRREIGQDAVSLLGSADGPAHSGDDLVEDQHHAVLVTQGTHAFQEAGRRARPLRWRPRGLGMRPRPAGHRAEPGPMRGRCNGMSS